MGNENGGERSFDTKQNLKAYAYLKESNPNRLPLRAAKEARYDKEAVMKFFRLLIRRRYFSDELPGASTWSAQVNRPLTQPGEIMSDDDQFYRTSRLTGDPYKYNVLPPLPAQRNLTPPPTLYPQQPVSTPDNYSISKFVLSNSSQDYASARSKRTDINV